tara:strand:- start:837 stop:1277 length:441 start_codon:yes stop_codon:yes gene_type:complete
MSINIDPKIWGESFWYTLHIISFTYPDTPNDTAKKKYYDLIQNLPLFLPNKKISDQFIQILDKYPVKPYLDSKVMFIKWMHFIHNEINKLNYKDPIPYDDYIQKITQSFIIKEIPKNTINYYDIYSIMFIIILIAVIWFESKIKIV